MQKGSSMQKLPIPYLSLITLCCCLSGCASREPNVRLSEWERGIAVESLDHPGTTMYLWFYEWNMFHAVRPHQHSPGGYQPFARIMSKDGRSAELRSDAMTLKSRAVRDGAELTLTLTNRSDHDWPEIAGIIPCFNPGPKMSPNPQFVNRNTYFVAREGLTRQEQREIHFNQVFRRQIDSQVNEDGEFVFSEKWPTSPVNATGGLMLRESADGQWVAGIAWERFISAQGHNPWECLHLCIRVGPLARGESRTIRGRIYLFMGTRDDLLRRYRRDFKHADSS
jgi:hypothetical protein